MSGRTGPDPEALLAAASELLAAPVPAMSGRWPRAVALLTRQAIEGTLSDLWRGLRPGVERVTMRAQLLVLRHTIGPQLASRAEYAWAATSRACHQHPFELLPTSQELAAWLEIARDLDADVRRRIARAGERAAADGG